MSNAALKLVTSTAKPRVRARKNAAPDVISQVRTAFAPGHRLAAAFGLAFGGFVPVATYLVSHRAMLFFDNIVLFVAASLLALGGLAFSAPTVYGWARSALGVPVKAIGFVVLLEGVMVFSSSLGLAYLGWAALAYLVIINAVATATRLATGQNPG